MQERLKIMNVWSACNYLEKCLCQNSFIMFQTSTQGFYFQQTFKTSVNKIFFNC